MPNDELRKFASQVVAMRALQDAFFKRKDMEILRQAKEAERAVDKRAREILEPGLFGSEE